MVDVTAIRCSRCGQDLPAEAFAPSHRTNGAWCRSCRSDYTRARYVPKVRRAPQPKQEPEVKPPRACLECGADTPARKRLCSDACRYQRRSRRKSVTIPPGLLLAIAKRDGFDCAVCGWPLDLDKVWPHPQSPSVDHIVPRSRGGDERLDNLQLTHLLCNWRKGRMVE